MKYNLKNRPVKSTPQKYEEWIKGLEAELRKRKTSIEKSLKTAITPVKIGYQWELALIKEILGEA